MNLKNFIKEVPNTLSNEMCDYFIDFYDTHMESAQRFEGRNRR